MFLPVLRYLWTSVVRRFAAYEIYPMLCENSQSYPTEFRIPRCPCAKVGRSIFSEAQLQLTMSLWKKQMKLFRNRQTIRLDFASSRSFGAVGRFKRRRLVGMLIDLPVCRPILSFIASRQSVLAFSSQKTMFKRVKTVAIIAARRSFICIILQLSLPYRRLRSVSFPFPSI